MAFCDAFMMALDLSSSKRSASLCKETAYLSRTVRIQDAVRFGDCEDDLSNYVLTWPSSKLMRITTTLV